MRSYIIYIVFLLSFATVGFGQTGSVSFKVSDDFNYNGTTTALHVRNNQNGVTKESQGLVLDEQLLNTNRLRLTFFLSNNTECPDCKLLLAPRNDVKVQQENLNFSRGIAETSFFVTFVDEVVFTSFGVTLLTPDGPSFGPYAVTLRLEPIKKAPPNTCKDIASLEDRLTCLENLDPTSDEVTLSINELKAGKRKAEVGLNEFRVQLLGNNVHQVSCMNCDATQYNLIPSPGATIITTVSPNKGWKVRVSRNATATVSSKSWRSLSKDYNLSFYPPKNNNGGLPSVPEVETETDEEDTPEVVDPDPIPGDTLDLDSIPLDTNSTAQEDSLWTTTIQPALSAENIFTMQDSLFSNLKLYAKNGRVPSRKVLAVIILYWWIILLVLFLLLLLPLFFRRKKKKTVVAPAPVSQSEPEPQSEPQPQLQTKPEPEPQPNYIKPKFTNEPEAIPAAPKVDEPPAESEEEILEEDIISIQEVEKEELAEEDKKLDLTQLVVSHDFVSINLKKNWQDSRIRRLYFGKKSIRAVARMLKLENAYDARKNNIEELSEIGGFLLGHFYTVNRDEYDVSILTFIPITPETNDRYTVKFGNQAWSELDDAYKTHPGQRLVGWFHTHPGHGLFLSNADIEVHRQSFEKAYQFAMEIDPTTPHCDISFFTWKKSGSLNNREDRLMSRWWSFLELERKSMI